jgi:uncharacterized protein (TIGR04551 family)
MNRLLLAAALATSMLSPGAVQAQTSTAPTPPPAKTAPKAGNGSETDAKIQEAVRRETARIKEELRDELRAESQGAQAEAAFMGTEEKPRLQFLELNGYLRLRADLLHHLDLNRDPDPSGYFLYPRPIIGTSTTNIAGSSELVTSAQHGTLTSANMRFRLEPTLNVSEQIRIRSQLDFLDNVVMGSTPESSQYAGSTFGTGSSGSQVSPVAGENADRNAVAVKRAWAEVQTPLGLLSFGRMPNQWGLGILANAGQGLDDDYGDNVDRVQFAIPVPTPLGNLTLVPHWDYIWSGVTSQNMGNAGIGQPFDRDQGDDVRGIGLKVVKLDSTDEMKRKLEKGLASFNYGLWWTYKAQTFDFPTASVTANPDPNTGNTPGVTVNPTSIRRDASAHVLDLWARYETSRFRLEFEGAAIYGQIGNAQDLTTNPNTIGPVLLRQFGGVLQGVAKLAKGRLQLGGELGMASGDSNPGFGNYPGRRDGANYSYGPAIAGDIDGQKFAKGDNILDIRNFRFNRAYRTDLILWREIIGGVTGAWYLKPTLRWEMVEGVVGTAQVVYSYAFYASSTPSQVNNGLGIEGDLGLSYTSDDGFVAWLNYGLLIPLDGLRYKDPNGHTELNSAQVLRAGLAVKF